MGGGGLSTGDIRSYTSVYARVWGDVYCYRQHMFYLYALKKVRKCMYIYIYIYMYACMYVYIYVCMYVCMHACMSVCIYKGAGEVVLS